MSKQIVRQEGAARTPAVIVSELTRFGKLEGMKVECNRFYKYFSFEGEYFETTHLNNNGSVGEAVAIRRISREDLNYLLPTAIKSGSYNYKIGGF